MYEINPDFTATITTVFIDSDSFSVTDDRCTGVLLAQDVSCTLEVIFNPRQVGLVRSSIIINLTHICMSDDYWPCSPLSPEDESYNKNFTRTEYSTGEIVIDWQESKGSLNGEGTP